MAATVEAGPRLELRARNAVCIFHIVAGGPITSAIFSYFSRCISKKLDWKSSSRDLNQHPDEMQTHACSILDLYFKDTLRIPSAVCPCPLLRIPAWSVLQLLVLPGTAASL